MTHPVLAVVGATATGKSELGLLLAERLGGEVVNADAMQLYRGMDIGTAKLTEAERRGVAHHQLDVLDVTQEASVAAYQAAARHDIAAIRGRGHVPVLVGGSGLYVRAVLDRLEIPPTDPQVRQVIEREADRVGSAALHERLARADPAAAAQILPGNVRRVVRALEVIELTGRPFSATLPVREFVTPTVVLGLRSDRTELADRIEQRIHRMWRRGLVDEVACLLERGLRNGVTASRAIGYRQAMGVIDGELDDTAAMNETAAATRKYARRQQSWFGGDPRVEWLGAETPDLLDRALEAITASAPVGLPTPARPVPQNG
ncbi:MAG: tRNA (adenosine(37)-N6)-dimethylallyltransferase MiaA [Humibacillus sp.]|nr:tRNA (adenosine(37)-N6)-dimethylallyltransferase MiaA [Humibacillus sp.]MDN5780249.1 tRNA (adenosine(37)-N6)-dimethylallyltransferase MiaA [Humibacillus sp.]